MNFRIAVTIATMASAGLVHAVATPEEAARLGKDLTPWGAEKSGNKEGTIPAYTGGLPVNLLGAGYDSNKNIVNGRQITPDPFKDEKPLFRITAANLAQYADKLTETQKALFKIDPAYYMDVFPSHRVVNPPQHYIDASLKNATRCHTEQNGDEMKGCKGGTPFPIPKTGAEVMWNLQIASFAGIAADFESPAYYVDRNGATTLTVDNYSYQSYPYQDPRISLEDYEGKNSYSHIWYRAAYDRRAPPRISGEANLLIISTNNDPSASWVYQPGNRRVRVNPNAAYDFPIAASGGSAFFDEAFVFEGRLDRFDWKLEGKKEMIMPYSAYRLAYGDKDQVMMAGHPKPDAMRWELHRAWVVVGTRKSGVRHAFSKRRYFVDEDMASAAMSDQYDDDGKVVRGGFLPSLYIWDYQCSLVYFYNIDLATGVYWTLGHPGNSLYGGNRFRNPVTAVGGFNNGPLWPESSWSPEALPRRSQK